MTKLDDKAGYDHILSTEESRAYVGLEWTGWWFVNATLPFGWKNSPFVNQSIGLAVISYLRDLAVVCSLYVDDRLVGELFTQEGFWSKPFSQREGAVSTRSAESSLDIVCRVLIMLGYTLGLAKCVLIPTIVTRGTGYETLQVSKTITMVLQFMLTVLRPCTIFCFTFALSS